MSLTTQEPLGGTLVGRIKVSALAGDPAIAEALAWNNFARERVSEVRAKIGFEGDPGIPMEEDIQAARAFLTLVEQALDTQFPLFPLITANLADAFKAFRVRNPEK